MSSRKAKAKSKKRAKSSKRRAKPRAATRTKSRRPKAARKKSSKKSAAPRRAKSTGAKAKGGKSGNKLPALAPVLVTLDKSTPTWTAHVPPSISIDEDATQRQTITWTTVGGNAAGGTFFSGGFNFGGQPHQPWFGPFTPQGTPATSATITDFHTGRNTRGIFQYQIGIQFNGVTYWSVLVPAPDGQPVGSGTPNITNN